MCLTQRKDKATSVKKKRKKKKKKKTTKKKPTKPKENTGKGTLAKMSKEVYI